MITVYQIQISDQDYNTVNEKGYDSVPAYLAKTRMSFGADKWNSEYSDFYKPVFEVYVDDLDEAFEETNLWENEEIVNRIPGTRGHSTSVGDILKHGNNIYIVDKFGFTQIENFKG